MNYNQFKIFKPTIKFRLSVSTLVYSLFLTFLLTTILSAKFISESSVMNISLILTVLTLATVVILLITSQFTKEKIYGEFCGILELKESSIIIDNNEISIDKIKDIDFSFDDYLGSWEYNRGKYDLNPKRSNGIKNYCVIKTTENECLKIQFQQLNKDDFLNNRDTIIIYHKKGKISFMRLIHMLNIEGYDKIQQFKKELTENK